MARFERLNVVKYADSERECEKLRSLGFHEAEEPRRKRLKRRRKRRYRNDGGR